MTERGQLHELVEGLPESELGAAERYLRYLRDLGDPLARVLFEAPWDDEESGEEEEQEVEEAQEQLARGEGIPDTELWPRLGHVPRD